MRTAGEGNEAVWRRSAGGWFREGKGDEGLPCRSVGVKVMRH
jgi:hypothetical protein